MTQARITGWSELEGSWPRNESVEVSGDGPINDFPLGSVCHINPPEDPDPQLGRGAGWIEIDLDELNAKITMFTAEGEQ